MSEIAAELSPDQAAPAARPEGLPLRFALLGNPNSGKTTLFNRLCGLRSKTANFPGSTIAGRLGQLRAESGEQIEIVDLPGTYGLLLNQPESQICREYLNGRVEHLPQANALLIVVDATNLARHLVLVAEARAIGLPTVVAVNMTDRLDSKGLRLNLRELQNRLGCIVVPTSARKGAGMEQLSASLALPTPLEFKVMTSRDERIAFADSVAADCLEPIDPTAEARPAFTDRLDAVLTHPVSGLLMFAVVMSLLFMTIFQFATIPMDLIELTFASLGGWLESIIPAGAINDLVVDGVVGGIAGTVVFLPQICLLFFLITLLEDSGYLARAAFVMDGIMQRFGLPGQAFVPLLNAHACAIPAIMSARLIPDARDRLATILVAPFLSCSARLPVYVLLIGILFPDRPLFAGIAFAACYVLGAAAALLTALLFRTTILRGRSRPMMLELPAYKLPSLRNAFLTTIDRATLFLRKAGTIIVGICIVLWWLSAYPQLDSAQSAQPQVERVVVEDEGPASQAIEPAVKQSRRATAHSFMGRIGRATAPVFEPIGADWQLSIGILTSFAAREVFVSTLAVIFTAEEDTEDPAVTRRIRNAQRDDGTPVFTTSSAAGILVFYVLAMQCLPTLAVTAREAGGWKWAAIQFAYMSIVAWIAALAARQVMLAVGFS